MEHTAAFVAISASVFISMLIPIFLPLLFPGERYQASLEKARARRIVDAKMNARRLRFNL